MIWTKARKNDLPEFVAFLSQEEWTCVSLTSRLRETGIPTPLSLRNRGVLYGGRDSDGRLKEVLYHGTQGVMIPVLRSDPGRPIVARADIAALFGSSRPFLHSIIGMRDDVITLERTFDIPAYRSIDYHLMILLELPRMPHGEELPVRGLVCRRADPADTQALFCLQKGYEIEEVLLHPERFSREACMSQLKETLRNEIVVTALLDGEPVAKANTNARGFAFAQIGGVYTGKAFRNRRIGEYLMRYLLTILAGKDYRACLFVKTDNAAAIALYRRLGFTGQGGFRITYYR